MAAIEVLGLRWFAVEASKAEFDVAALVSSYSEVLYRVAFSILRNPTEAEDTVQDTFLRVVQHRAELEAIRDPRTWLIRIAWNLALDRRRKVTPEQLDDEVAAKMEAKGPAADDPLAAARRMKKMFGAIDALPRKEREAMLLSVIEELSTGEIAAVLGRSEAGVRSLLFRARAHLRERLQQQDAAQGDMR